MTARDHLEPRPQRARSPETVPAHARELGYEPSDYPAASVARWLGVLFVVLGASMGAIALLLDWWSPARQAITAGEAASRFTSPAPPLEIAPPADRLRLDRAQAARLTGAAPGSRPIEAAMRDVAKSGWNEPEPAPPPPRAETATRRARTLP